MSRSLFIFKRNNWLLFYINNFQERQKSIQDIRKTQWFKNGIRVFCAIYDPPKKINSLDKQRYFNFLKNMRSNKGVQLSCLPATSFFWSTFTPNLLTNSTLEGNIWPIRLELEIDWQYLGANSGIATTCSRKTAQVFLATAVIASADWLGLFCSLICTNCYGRFCFNIVPDLTVVVDIWHFNKEMDDASVFLD